MKDDFRVFEVQKRVVNDDAAKILESIKEKKDIVEVHDICGGKEIELEEVEV
jgi:hypothetical protein